MSYSFHHVTRGGQLLLHNLRMVSQILQYVLWFAFGVFVLVMTWWYVAKTPAPHRELWVAWYQAKAHVYFNDPTYPLTFHSEGNTSFTLIANELLNTPRARRDVAVITKHLIKGAELGVGIAFGVFFIVLFFLQRYGRAQSKHQLLRGVSLVTPITLKKLLVRAGQASHLHLGGVPLIKNAEVQHIFIHGTVGAGKSVCMKSLMDQVRDKKQRAIVYDKGGDFMQSFFREGKDIVLNPLDERSADWHVWADCCNSADYDTLAAAFMPLPAWGGSDPFWIHAARTIFAMSSQQLANDPKRSTARLLQYLFTSDLDSIYQLLKGTEAETLVSEKTAKTALNVKSVLVNYLRSLKYLRKTTTPFSIRQWVQTEEDSWLFITSQGDKHETLKPLISAWLNTAANALLSLRPDPKRRIWLFLDELPTLHRLPYLPEAFAEARKFGGCLVAAVQSIEQLKKIYGQHAAHEIAGLCNTRVFFRSTDASTAQWVSQNLGQSECEETQEGISYGANTIRDGVSIGKHRFIKQPILSAEVEALDDLDAYLRLKGQWPVTKIRFTPASRPCVAKSFIARTLTNSAQETEEISLDPYIDTVLDLSDVTALSQEEKTAALIDSATFDELLALRE